VTTEQLLTPGPDAASGEERWGLAGEIAQQACRRYPAEVLAVGVHGALAHDDDREGSDLEITIVTYQPRTGPLPTSRRIDGWIVNLTTLGIDEYLWHARSVTTRWPLTADQYLHMRILTDEQRCFDRVRDMHLARLAETSGREFSALAREAWCRAYSLYQRAGRCTEWFDTDGALLLLAEARVAAAAVEGLLTRTYFRGTADAARRTGTGSLDLTELAERLDVQAAELAQRGRPVNGSVEALFG
jgi:hypothetical protein